MKRLTIGFIAGLTIASLVFNYGGSVLRTIDNLIVIDSNFTLTSQIDRLVADSVSVQEQINDMYSFDEQDTYEYNNMVVYRDAISVKLSILRAKLLK